MAYPPDSGSGLSMSTSAGIGEVRTPLQTDLLLLLLTSTEGIQPHLPAFADFCFFLG